MAEDSPIPAEAVKAQLDRILASKGFANAGRVSRLLHYVVGKTLAGEAEQLKEYSVGIEVFDRNDSYDPRIDSIVRVEAGRLRSRLDEYYNAEGATDDVRIVLPRGGYSALFERRGQTVVPAIVASQSMWTPALAGLAALALAFIAFWLYGSRSRHETPTIAVLAFEQYSSSGEDESVAAQLTDGVTSELARLGTLSVVSHTSAMQFAGIRKPLREIAAALEANVILEGSVENRPDGIVVVARLVNAATDRKMWVENFPGKAGDLPDLNRRIAVAASAAVLSRK